MESAPPPIAEFIPHRACSGAGLEGRGKNSPEHTLGVYPAYPALFQKGWVVRGRALALAVFAKKCYYELMLASSARNFAAVILFALASVILFCTWGVSAVSMDKPISDCVSQQSHSMLCGINPQSHALVWQNFLHVTTQKMLEVLLAALLLVITLFVGRTWLHAPSLVAQHLRTRIRQGLSIIDPIRRALSRGIIQPQIYELAIG